MFAESVHCQIGVAAMSGVSSY